MSFLVSIFYIWGFLMSIALASSLFVDSKKFKIGKNSISAYLIWSTIGLLSSQWLFFLVHIIINIVNYKILHNSSRDSNISVVTDNKEVKVISKYDRMMINVFKFVNLLFISFLVINYFHLHINLTELIINLL